MKIPWPELEFATTILKIKKIDRIRPKSCILAPNFRSAAARAAGSSRKISAFSFREIDRSLLLEDFLRKSEIFVLWAFWAM